MLIWGAAVLLSGRLAWKARRLARYPAFRVYLFGAPAAAIILKAIKLTFGNTWYGPYWYGYNVHQTLEVSLLAAILGELLGEARKGIYAGALLALGVAFGDPGLSMTVQCVLSVVAGFLSFIEDPRGHVAQGVFVMLVFPLISGYSSEPWAAYIPTVSAVVAMMIWLYSLKFIKGEKNVGVSQD